MKYDETLKTWVLNIQKPLNDDAIEGKSELVITLTANADGFDAGVATLVVEIEKELVETPKFKKALYLAEYPKSGKGLIDINDIDFDNIVDGSKISIAIDSKWIHTKEYNYTIHQYK